MRRCVAPAVLLRPPWSHNRHTMLTPVDACAATSRRRYHIIPVDARAARVRRARRRRWLVAGPHRVESMGAKLAVMSSAAALALDLGLIAVLRRVLEAEAVEARIHLELATSAAATSAAAKSPAFAAPLPCRSLWRPRAATVSCVCAYIMYVHALLVAHRTCAVLSCPHQRRMSGRSLAAALLLLPLGLVIRRALSSARAIPHEACAQQQPHARFKCDSWGPYVLNPKPQLIPCEIAHNSI